MLPTWNQRINRRGVCFLTLLLLFQATILWASSGPIELYKAYKQKVELADQKTQKGFYLDAMELYKKALQQFQSVKKDHADWGPLILVDIQIGRCEDKVRELGKLIERVKTFKEKYQLQKGMTPEVLRSAESEKFESLLRRGDALLGTKEFQRAMDYYNQALKLQPKNPYVLLNKAIALFKIKNAEKSLEIFNFLIKEYPRYSAAFFNKADMFYTLGKLDEAIPMYVKAIELDPEDLRSRVNLGVIYVKKEMYNKALDEFKSILDKNDESADVHYNLGVIYSDYLFNRKRAIFHYKKYLMIVPTAVDRAEVESWIQELQQTGDSKNDENNQ